jgi:hypothetical protein
MWKSVSSRQLAAALNITLPVWQSEYFDRLSSVARKIWAKMELRGAKSSASGIDQRRRGMAIQRFAL